MIYVYIVQGQKSLDFLDVMCVKECIVYRICLLVNESGGWRQEVLWEKAWPLKLKDYLVSATVACNMYTLGFPKLILEHISYLIF